MDDRLQTAKDNIETIQKIMSTWRRTPLFERTEGKSSTLLYLSDRDERLKKRYNEIGQASLKIHELIKVCYLLYLIFVKMICRPICKFCFSF